MDHDLFLKFMDMIEILQDNQLRQVEIKVALTRSMLARAAERKSKTWIGYTPLMFDHGSEDGLTPDVDD